MRILTGYMPATEGTVHIAGYDCFESPLEVKKTDRISPRKPTPLLGINCL